MYGIRTRMTGLHQLLTGGTVPTAAYSYPPRHLWGDIGQPGGRQRRAFSARLARWWGTGR